MRTLTKWIGHQSIQTTESYADVLPDQVLGQLRTNRDARRCYQFCYQIERIREQLSVAKYLEIDETAL
jgi:hypothetical protein